MICFHPKPGMVLMCDFSTGFQPPEMVKKRRVVVVSPSRLNGTLCRVVPISTTPPVPELTHHCKFTAGSYEFLHPEKPCWAKGDMVTNVSLQRLDRIRLRNHFMSPTLFHEDYQRVIKAVLSALSIELE